MVDEGLIAAVSNAKRPWLASVDAPRVDLVVVKSNVACRRYRLHGVELLAGS